MLPSDRRFIDDVTLLLAVYGIAAVLLIVFLPFGLLSASFLLGLPVFVTFLSFGDGRGIAVASVLSVVSLLLLPGKLSLDTLLSVVVPAALIGHLSIRSITVKRQIWWYPESFLLQNFMLLSFASVIFMSLFVHSEESLQKTVDEACNILFRSDDPQMILLKQSVVTMVKYSVGMGTLTKMLLTLITFCLARLITEKIKKNILPGFDFCNLTMNGFMAVVPVTALTAALLFPDVSFVCSGIFMVGLFAPLMCGFAVIRRLSRGRNGLRLRIILWCLMLFLTLPTILGIILLGIADSFYPLCRDVTEV